jgi:hypothetical protein
LIVTAVVDATLSTVVADYMAKVGITVTPYLPLNSCEFYLAASSRTPHGSIAISFPLRAEAWHGEAPRCLKFGFPFDIEQTRRRYGSEQNAGGPAFRAGGAAIRLKWNDSSFHEFRWTARTVRRAPGC